LQHGELLGIVKVRLEWKRIQRSHLKSTHNDLSFGFRQVL
jgi:hypothetical protein